MHNIYIHIYAFSEVLSMLNKITNKIQITQQHNKPKLKNAY